VVVVVVLVVLVVFVMWVRTGFEDGGGGERPRRVPEGRMWRRMEVGEEVVGLGVREREWALRPRIGGVGERLTAEGERVRLRLRLRELISISSGLRRRALGLCFDIFSGILCALRNSNSPHLTILTSCPSTGRSFSSTVTSSILRTVSIPLTTCPKHTFFMSRCVAASKVMKNWLLLVSGPRLAMQTSPGQSIERHPRFSSGKCGP